MADASLSAYGLDLLKSILTLVISTVISINVTNRISNQSKARGDFTEKRVDDICSEIRAVADLSTDYWVRCLPQTSQDQLTALESRIQSRLRYVEELRSLLARHNPELKSTELTEASGDLFRMASGGNFGVKGRPQDLASATGVQNRATRYISAIRRARAQTHYKE